MNKFEEKVKFWEDAVDHAIEALETSKNIDRTPQMIRCYEQHLVWCRHNLEIVRMKRAETIGRKKK